MIDRIAGKFAGPILVKVIIGLAGVTFALGIALLIQGWRLDAAKGKAAEAEAALSLAADANVTNLATIAKLQADLDEAVGQSQAIDRASEEMERARRNWIAQMQREIRSLKAELDKDYADPDCAALAAMPVCRRVNDRLHALANPN